MGDKPIMYTVMTAGVHVQCDNDIRKCLAVSLIYSYMVFRYT
jgi:hypothetical protein